MFSVGCGFDIIRRIEAEETYALNLIFHPISAMLFLYLLFKILERSKKDNKV